ncbi:MAG: Asp-tRNA(Asn)/Glu-tRNA(Gln) amidotransferase subunit GatC [Candidatus Sungbacteria bacterium]|nr:Asp-tRNA(Asn)/Glu-tRNA(Gln) amidotransferase subunit GatC [Candidatus Sungbacteria bacterium]
MTITGKEVEHISQLARIELTDAEKQKFEKELSAILEFVEKLNEVETGEVEPTTGGTVLENVMRPDEQTSQDLEGKSAELIGSFPDKKGGWTKVKAVFD